jgi:glycosyltransferase involved in cell wall biosynthesis
MTDSSPLRIAVWHNLPSGGGKRVLHDQVQGLVRRGHFVEVWCPSSADTAYLPLGDIVDEHVDVIRVRPPLTTLVLERYGLHSDVPRRLRVLDRHCRRAAANIGDRFDVLFANSSVWFRAAPIARYAQIPTLLILGEPFRKLYEALPRLAWLDPNPIKRRALRRQALEERQAVEAFDQVLVCSMYSRESVLRAYGVDPWVCYPGVDTNRFVPSSASRGDYVVGLGAFLPEKNIEFIIRALALLAPNAPPLVWIGNLTSAPHLESLKTLARELGVPFDPRTRLDDGEVLALLQEARAMVYAPRLEPLGLAPLEAASCGTPVVAVAEGGVRETVIDGVTGFLVVNSDLERFAGSVRRLLDDPELADALGAQGREIVVDRWGLEASVDRLEHHLRTLAER